MQQFVNSPSHRHLHTFGYVYSPKVSKQVFFSEQAPSESARRHSIHQENYELKRQLQQVRKILSSILYSEGQGRQQEKTLMELLEELLLLILSKAQQNAILKQKLEEMKVQTVQNIDSRVSVFNSSKPQSNASSNSGIQTPFQESQLNLPPPQPSKAMNGGVSKYWPKVLFSLGKQVKTISQISTNKLMKKESHHSYSKSSSQESSFKELMNLRQDRLSIDKSIYVTDDNLRYSIRDSCRESLEHITGKNIGSITPVSNQLTPIKEERHSDMYSEINASKIKQAVYVNGGERFTFESTNTDRESYYTSKH